MANRYVDSTLGNDGNAGTSPGSGNAWQTIAYAITNMGAGNTLHVKNAATYTITAALIPSLGTAGTPTIIQGYNSTPGDLDSVNDFANFPTIQVSSGSPHIFTLNNSYVHIRNLILDQNNLGARCINGQSNYHEIENVKCLKFTGHAVLFQGSSNRARRVWVTQGKAASTVGFYTDASGNTFELCWASDNPCPGYQNAGAAGTLFERCIADTNTGSSSDGFIDSGTNGAKYVHCIAYANGRDGIRFSGGNSADYASVYGCILSQNSAYGLRSVTASLTDAMMDYNAFYSNTSGARFQTPTGAHDVTLSGDPFTDAANSVFSSNNTAGAGAALRGVASPGGFPGGLATGYLDIGVFQHQEIGGALLRPVGMNGGFI